MAHATYQHGENEIVAVELLVVRDDVRLVCIECGGLARERLRLGCYKRTEGLRGLWRSNSRRPCRWAARAVLRR